MQKEWNHNLYTIKKVQAYLAPNYIYVYKYNVWSHLKIKIKPIRWLFKKKQW